MFSHKFSWCIDKSACASAPEVEIAFWKWDNHGHLPRKQICMFLLNFLFFRMSVGWNSSKKDAPLPIQHYGNILLAFLLKYKLQMDIGRYRGFQHMTAIINQEEKQKWRKGKAYMLPCQRAKWSHCAGFPFYRHLFRCRHTLLWYQDLGNFKTGLWG